VANGFIRKRNKGEIMPTKRIEVGIKLEDWKKLAALAVRENI